MADTIEDAVPIRDVHLEERFADVPRYFAGGGDPVLSHVLAVQSATFPDGEEFFIASVAAVRDQIDDEELLARVDGFIGQEGMHGREHRAFNAHLADLGYMTQAIECYTRWANQLFERIDSPLVDLAVTAALEHYTATLAEMILGNPEMREMFDDDAVRELFTWHALEESEHKAVAFDVYRHVGGTERMRLIVMAAVHIDFLAELAVLSIVSLLLDPVARRQPRTLARGLWNLRRSPFASRAALRQLWQYNHRGFHPNDRDTTGLVRDWRRRLFGADGEMVTEVG